MLGKIVRPLAPLVLAGSMFTTGCGEECTVEGPGATARSPQKVLSLCNSNPDTFFKCVNSDADDSGDAEDIYCAAPRQCESGHPDCQTIHDMIDFVFYDKDDVFCRQARTAEEIRVVCE